MKRVKKIIFVILSILLGLVLIFNIYNFVSLKVLHKDLATVNGYAILEVVSGSMEPTIHKGDMIIINTKEKNYKENDIITFKGKEGEFVTHRIKFIDDKTMITKGDNNNTEDDAIKTSSIVGKYVTKITGGGRILASFKNPFTLVMIFIIGLLACILLSTDKNGEPLLEKDEKEFQEFLKNKNESKKEESKKSEVKEIKDKKASEKKEVTNNSKKEIKETSSSKKQANKNSNDTKKTTSKKVAVKKPTAKKDTTVKKNTTKPVVKDESKQVETKKSEPKKTASKKEPVKKEEVKQTSKTKESTTKTTKKRTTTKSNKK